MGERGNRVGWSSLTNNGAWRKIDAAGYMKRRKVEEARRKSVVRNADYQCRYLCNCGNWPKEHRDVQGAIPCRPKLEKRREMKELLERCRELLQHEIDGWPMLDEDGIKYVSKVVADIDSAIEGMKVVEVHNEPTPSGKYFDVCIGDKYMIGPLCTKEQAESIARSLNGAVLRYEEVE